MFLNDKIQQHRKQAISNVISVSHIVAECRYKRHNSVHDQQQRRGLSLLMYP
jgi:hypothetical protein